ncbi:hypothetical protein GOBAR_AA24642 [Gossypium barbadense]|uniref:Uncharacterized protein n=1 Tax=Gossypium barbadense TaxID=3634 RepID=A0A2P5WY71_GOSBA|nr:hypothetical protein GOBAR_AA24642 [Gossypium barbadense]
MVAGTYAWHKVASTLMSKKKEKMGRASFYSIAFFSKFRAGKALGLEFAFWHLSTSNLGFSSGLPGYLSLDPTLVHSLFPEFIAKMTNGANNVLDN